MSSTPTAASSGPRPVRFTRRSTRGLILGFSTARCVALAVAIPIFVAGFAQNGFTGVALTSPGWGPLVASAFLRWKGRPIVEWLPVLSHWTVRSATGQTEYRARVSAPRPDGTLALPGDAAPLRVYVDESGVAMIHAPHRQTLSASVRVTHPAYVLLGPDDKRRRVSQWGWLLAGLSRTGTCAAIQVLEQTVPDPGIGIVGWYDKHGTHRDDWANREYQTLLAESARGTSTHRTTVTLSLDMRRAAGEIRARGRGVAAAAAVLRDDMTGLEHSLRSSELRVERWLGPGDLAMMVRQAYDPTADIRPDSPGANLIHAGPLAVSEHWQWFRHDNGYSTVLWISEWPRVDVLPDFLHALVFAPNVRKSLSIVARPLGSADALRQIRKERTSAIADSRQKAKVGQIADLADADEYADLLTRERAVGAGHADVELSGFLAITAESEQDLRAARSTIERAAATSGCEILLLSGRQTQGFIVAALPFARSVL